MSSTLDHIVVLAATLSDGVRWCESLLGVTPAAGGKHPLMGTHNRLVNISSFPFADCYMEIIALDPEASPQRSPGQKRWFDMDDPMLHAQVIKHGPQLAHFVVRCPDVHLASQALANVGFDCGRVLAASRAAPNGLLQWNITVRDDGLRLLGGAVPALIQWGLPSQAAPAHPTQDLPYSGLQLQGLQLSHPDATRIDAACGAIGLQGMQVRTGAPGLCAILKTQRSLVRLTSPEPV